MKRVIIFVLAALITLPAFTQELSKKEQKQLEKERFPYVDIFWDAKAGRPRLFHELSFTDEDELGLLLTEIFDSSNLYRQSNISEFMNHLDKLQVHKRVRIQESVVDKLSSALLDEELAIAATAPCVTWCYAHR